MGKLGRWAGKQKNSHSSPPIARANGDRHRIERSGMIVRLIKARLVAQGVSQYGLENEFNSDSYTAICVKLLFI